MLISKKLLSILIAASYSASFVNPAFADHHMGEMKKDNKEVQQIVRMNVQSSVKLVQQAYKTIQDAAKSNNSEKMMMGADLIQQALKMSGHHMMPMMQMKKNVIHKEEHEEHHGEMGMHHSSVLHQKHQMEKNEMMERHHKEHQEMMERHQKEHMDEYYKNLGITREEHHNLEKMITDSANLLISKGHEMISKSGNNSEKMLAGARLVNKGTELHHIGMMGKMASPKMIRQEKEIHIKK